MTAVSNGEVLTAEEELRVREALLSTAEGLTLRRGDLVLFDNLRFGHSRESFSGERVVLVGMAGEVWDPAVSESVRSRLARPQEALESIVTARRDSTQARLARPEHALGQRDSTQARLARPEHALGQRDSTPLQLARRDALKPLATDGSYSIPPRLVRRDQRFSTRVFDAGGALDDATVALIEQEFTRHGALHVRNTGITTNEAGGLPESTLRALRFGGADAFPWGGMSSGRTTRKALSRELRATDEYPAHLWLLPHNEVLYQRTLPARLLFFSAKQLPDDVGGRTFVHSSKLFEQTLRDLGGAALLDDLRRHGLLIEMGFIDDGHPKRHLNFFRSWQERFNTTDREEAARRCRASTHQFDECWWRDEGGGHATLMTRIRVPAFCDGHLLFPRIALDEPSVRNGHRRYPRGDGVPFTKLEVDLLLHAFLETREGTAWGAGDVLLVDNVRYGHSREAYSGPRSLGVAMAGVVDVGPPP